MLNGGESVGKPLMMVMTGAPRAISMEREDKTRVRRRGKKPNAEPIFDEE